MHTEKSLKVISKMAPRDRWSLAREKLYDSDHAGVTQTLLSHMRLHENTRWLVYLPDLADQIPRSRAAHAFRELQNSVLFYEIVRLCTFWDPVDLDSRSIPTICALADCRGVSACVYADHFSKYENFDYTWARAYGVKARRRLREGVRNAREITASDELRNVRNFRDKLAHQLEKTRLEKSTAVPRPRYGDEKKLLRKTVATVDRLYLSLSGTDLSWSESQAMHRRNAEAFWKGVKIDVLR